jgi:ABC-type Zn uptake system ZnuABC Zn-binding protein ZnuA
MNTMLRNETWTAMSRPRARWFLGLSAMVACPLAGCHSRGGADGSVRYVATIPPLGAILREVVGNRGQVEVLLPPGASPHTFEPSPSDARRASGATVVYVAQHVDDWAARIPAKNHLATLDLLPESFRRGFTAMPGDDHIGGTDPHFWTDPLAVQALLPALVKRLAELDPGGRAAYEANASRFHRKLQALHDELRETLKPVRGQRVALFHPSFNYLFARYGIVCAAVVEVLPGKEPTARNVERMIGTLRRTGARAVFTEPQLPRKPAEILAEGAGIPVGELDPLGGEPGRMTYADLLRFNARALRECVK